MSASTVSITATPGAQQRPVVLTDKRTKSANIELFSPANDAAAVDGDAAQVKDLNHYSLRGEVVFDRTPKEVVQVKKTSSIVSPRRTRKAAGPEKPDRPWCLRAVRVLAKNFVLLSLIFGLVQLVRKLVMPAESGASGAGFVGFEDRIANVDSLVKKMAQMMQLQLEVMDHKVGNVDRKFRDQAAFLEGEMGKLEDRVQGLENSVGDVKSMGGFLSKKEFERFYEELKKGKGGWSEGGDGSLDEIRVYARDVVEKEIEKHMADGIGRVDYALVSGGAKVVQHSEPYPKWGKWLLTAARGGVHPDAVRVVSPSFGEPGQCFALKGSRGYVEIRLRKPIVPDAFTLEHVAKSVAYDRSSAPEHCRVVGWLQSDLGTAFLLAEFAYDLEKSNAQTFDAYNPSGLVDLVRLHFMSNHGSPTHTCIYRFRVHGHEPDLTSKTSPYPNID